MRQMTRWFTVAVCGLTLSAGLALSAKPNVGNRQRVQGVRIKQGVRSGSLTPRETQRLVRNQQKIHRSIVHDRKDGGVFTPRERVKAHKRLNKQSRTIYRQKHDNQTRD